MTSNPEKKPRRTPHPAEIVIASGLKPNDHHPLAGIDPERRNDGRIDTIASVLAKLALRQSNQEKEVAS
jgi:hypothetical protein